MNSTELAAEPLSLKLKRRIKRAMGPWGVFLLGFIEHPVMVGSIIPSSRFTIQKMLAPVKWNECKLFVEYGPGVGTFCRPVLDRLPRDGTLAEKIVVPLGQLAAKPAHLAWPEAAALPLAQLRRQVPQQPLCRLYQCVQ